MLIHRRFHAASVVLIGGMLFAAACGGSSSPKPAAQSSQTNSETSQSSSSSSDAGSQSSSGGSAGVPGNIFDATYASGKAHVEMSGGASRTADLPQAGGYTTGGATVVSFTDANAQNALSISASAGEGGGISLTAGGISTAGEFGKDCQLEVTKNDASEFAGKITCNDVDGIEGSTIHNHVKVAATFSAKP